MPSRSSPVATVFTPTTFSSSTRSAPAGNPANTSTPASSAFSPNQRTNSQIDTTKFPWFFIDGGVGIRIARFFLSKYTDSPVTSVPKGRSSFVRSGNNSRNGRGLTTAPESECSPRAPAFSSTPILTSPSPSPFSLSSLIKRASITAPASPAGPPPTKRTSMSMRSSSGGPDTINSSCGSGAWNSAGVIDVRVTVNPRSVS